MKLFKKGVSFVDADGHRARVEVEITDRNGYPEFTASGTYMGSGGQCLDDIKPANSEQAALIQLWRAWHLNGMHAGTVEQEAAVKAWELAGNKYEYDAVCKHLKSIGLYEVRYPFLAGR